MGAGITGLATMGGGGAATGVRAGRAYVDVGTLHGYRAATTLLLRHGLFPIAWQTPQDAASRAVFTAVAQTFSTAVERPQLSDSTHLEKGLVSALTIGLDGVIYIADQANLEVRL